MLTRLRWIPPRQYQHCCQQRSRRRQVRGGSGHRVQWHRVSQQGTPIDGHNARRWRSRLALLANNKSHPVVGQQQSPYHPCWQSIRNIPAPAIIERNNISLERHRRSQHRLDLPLLRPCHSLCCREDVDLLQCPLLRVRPQLPNPILAHSVPEQAAVQRSHQRSSPSRRPRRRVLQVPLRRSAHHLQHLEALGPAGARRQRHAVHAVRD